MPDSDGQWCFPAPPRLPVPAAVESPSSCLQHLARNLEEKEGPGLHPTAAPCPDPRPRARETDGATGEGPQQVTPGLWHPAQPWEDPEDRVLQDHGCVGRGRDRATPPPAPPRPAAHTAPALPFIHMKSHKRGRLRARVASAPGGPAPPAVRGTSALGGGCWWALGRPRPPALPLPLPDPSHLYLHLLLPFIGPPA